MTRKCTHTPTYDCLSLLCARAPVSLLCLYRVKNSVPGSSADERIALDAGPSLPMCDICQARPCVIFCKEDRALLCASCDAAMHSANKFVCMHTRFLLSGSTVAPGGSPMQAGMDMQLAMPQRLNMERVRGKRSAEQARPEVPARFGNGASASAAAATPSSFRGATTTSGMYHQQQQQQQRHPAQPMAFVDGNPVAELLQIPNLGGDYGIKDVDDFGDFSNAEWEGLQSVLFEAPQSVPDFDEGKRAMGGSLLSGGGEYNDDSAVPDFGGASRSMY